MKKRILLVTMLLTALFLSGCSMRTVEDMYALPKRPEEYNDLQNAIDMAMYGLTFSSPQSGEHQQTVQLADLDGDGIEEYLVYAKGASEKPLQILIFSQDAEGKVRTMETIGITGLSFEQVEYVEFDENPGCELVVGFQVSDQVLRSVAVYSFHNGDARLQLLTGCSRFLVCDLDQNDRSELMVFRPGEGQMERGMALLYSFQNGQVGRSVETELSQDPAHIRRITYGLLQDGVPAVYVASSADEEAIVTDIFAMKNGRFTNICFSTEAQTSISTLRNFYVYAEDLDGDGIMELPSLITMKPVSAWEANSQKFLLRWFSVDLDGWETDKVFTFHNYMGGWYLQLDSIWAGRVTVDQNDGVYSFYVWDESYQEATGLFTVYVFTDSTRDEDAFSDGRFALYRAEGVAYAARIEPAAADYGITEEHLVECFRLVRQDWQTGET